MEKQKGILIRWNDPAGYGFVAIGRNSDGTRITRFIHAKFIERCDCPGGVPEVGSTVLFNEAPDPRGPICVNAEILAKAPLIDKAAIKHLSGVGQ